MNNKKKTAIIGLVGTILFCGLSHFTDNTGLKIFFMVMALWSVAGAGWRLVRKMLMNNAWLIKS